jgi:hypothetical protein
MEVKAAVQVPEGRVEDGGQSAEAEATHTEPVLANLLLMLKAHWVRMAAFLLVLSLVLAALWVARNHGEWLGAGKSVTSLHAVTASLGGEHYVHFRLRGPFRDEAGKAVLKRAMPRIRDDLILSGGQPEIARSIADDDMNYLRRHILGIVSLATGIPVEELDVKGLSVTRYSDEAGVEGGG